MKSSIKSDRNWGPEDPMLQHQWHQIHNPTSTQLENDCISNVEECSESKNINVIMKRLFSTSTPNKSKEHIKGTLTY